MAHYKCKVGMPHPTLQGAKYCDLPVNWHANYETPASSAIDGERRRVIHTSEPATEAQRRYAATLGGTIPAGFTRLEASRRIDALKKRKEARDEELARQRAEQEKEARARKMQFGIPFSMLQMIHEGRFVVSLDGSGKLYFVRVSVVKERRGMAWSARRHVGSIKVQTQHSDDLIDRAYISPDGRLTLLSNTMGKEKLEQLLVSIITDQRKAAILYGQELGQCCRCGRSLTDERSRYFSIGPECEQHWPEIIDEVTEMKGRFVPVPGYAHGNR